VITKGDQDTSAKNAERVEPLDCRALIDECLTRKDWIKLFRRLRDSDTVSAAALLLRHRFGPPHPNAVVKDQPVPMQLSMFLPEKEDYLETTPGTADEISPQPGG
jgi:hypothetical protein